MIICKLITCNHYKITIPDLWRTNQNNNKILFYKFQLLEEYSRYNFNFHIPAEKIHEGTYSLLCERNAHLYPQSLEESQEKTHYVVNHI